MFSHLITPICDISYGSFYLLLNAVGNLCIGIRVNYNLVVENTINGNTPDPIWARRVSSKTFLQNLSKERVKEKSPRLLSSRKRKRMVGKS